MIFGKKKEGKYEAEYLDPKGIEGAQRGLEYRSTCLVNKKANKNIKKILSSLDQNCSHRFYLIHGASEMLWEPELQCLRSS